MVDGQNEPSLTGERERSLQRRLKSLVAADSVGGLLGLGQRSRLGAERAWKREHRRAGAGWPHAAIQRVQVGDWDPADGGPSERERPLPGQPVR